MLVPRTATSGEAVETVLRGAVDRAPEAVAEGVELLEYHGWSRTSRMVAHAGQVVGDHLTNAHDTIGPAGLIGARTHRILMDVSQHVHRRGDVDRAVKRVADRYSGAPSTWWHTLEVAVAAGVAVGCCDDPDGTWKIVSDLLHADLPFPDTAIDLVATEQAAVRLARPGSPFIIQGHEGQIEAVVAMAQRFGRVIWLHGPAIRTVSSLACAAQEAAADLGHPLEDTSVVVGGAANLLADEPSLVSFDVLDRLSSAPRRVAIAGDTLDLAAWQSHLLTNAQV